ncbi:hypothetical protein NAF17_12965 [Mucilaginibacter sp. RB4R14]|uniref:hypothetical protein n=1 Tax=Mucilaginibacter aurantiaciroseus TaxID=2949308 RepID=UPI002090D39F|nr:hypothetical protein [Mucilaginibacter aurantiaciroseus]MCO5936451.1 hypothetical protein [Mucilaginibacter aurantiaciroseus]
MHYPVNHEQFTTDVEYYSEVIDLHKRAENYLLGFKWCKKINSSSLYTNLGSKLCIFLFEIDNLASREDNMLWIITGDIPSMYLDIYGPKSTREVLRTYVELAEAWIEHIKSGKSVDECYPFNAEPTNQVANLLKNKITFVKNVVIENIEDVYLKV